MTLVQISLIRIDGGTQPRASIDEDTVSEYRLDMIEGSLFPPVTVYFDGTDYWLADGFHRLYAAKQLGNSHIDADVVEGAREDAQWHSYAANKAHGLRRSNQDKRRAVEAALRHPFAAKKSSTEIANHCGVSHMTILRYKDNLNIVQDTRVVHRNGTSYEMNVGNIGKTADPEYVSVDPATGELWSHEQPEPPSYDDLPDAVDDRDIDPVTGEVLGAFQEPEINASKPANAALFTSDSYEWYTPPHIIALVRQVLGEIELDPASSFEANKTVQARAYFDKHRSGLEHPWFGAVYFNPPYGADIGDWVNKLCDEYEAGRIDEALTLLPARTDTAWMRRLARFQRCFIWGRLKFIGGSDNSATFPSVMIYLGNDSKKFAAAFKDIGDIYVLWSTG